MTEEQRLRRKEKSRAWWASLPLEERRAIMARSKRLQEQDPTFRERRRLAGVKYRASEKGKAAIRANKKLYKISSTKRRDRRFKEYHKGRITRQQADLLIQGQNNLCAICQRPPRGKGPCSRLQVDHNHSTGKIREMLCSNCNLALGYAGESVEVLLSMAAYINKHRSA